MGKKSESRGVVAGGFCSGSGGPLRAISEVGLMAGVGVEGVGKVSVNCWECGWKLMGRWVEAGRRHWGVIAGGTV